MFICCRCLYGCARLVRSDQLGKRQDVEVIEWHSVTISAKYDQTVEEYDGSVAVPRHRIAIDHAQLWLCLQVKRLIESLHLAVLRHATDGGSSHYLSYVQLASLRTGICRPVILVSVGLGHEEPLAQVVNSDAFLIVTLSHLDEVLVEALVLIQKKGSALHLELSGRVLFSLVVEHAKCIEFIVVAGPVCIDAALRPSAGECARQILGLHVNVVFVHS